MAEHNDFHILRRRVRMTGVLRCETGLRIGAGSNGDDPVDMPVLRDADGYPFLPGASLKGVLRSTIESLLRAVDVRGGAHPLWACDPLSDQACGHHTSGNRLEAKNKPHCTACRLFGSVVVASHVRISDALCQPRVGRPPIALRDGVAINRDLGKVHGAQKYDFQVVSPGTRFGLEVFSDNLDDWMLGLMVVGFEQISEGFTAIGGFTSRGLGRVGIDWQQVTDLEPARLLASGGEMPTDIEHTFASQREVWVEALRRYVAREQS